MKLLRVDNENVLFRDIEQQWSRQCDEYGAEFDEFAAPAIEHAKEISDGKLLTNQYGVYTLIDDDQFELIAHLNTVRLPGTVGVTLRVLWILIAPKYDYVDVSADILARV